MKKKLGLSILFILLGILSVGEIVTNAAQSGFVTWENFLFYYYPETGERATGLTTIEGDTYYFYEGSGAALSGIQKINDKIYYFDKTTFKQVVGVAETQTGRSYFFEKDGGVRTGVVEWEGKTYYFEPTKSGLMQHGLVSVGKELYYFDKTTGHGAINKNINFSHVILTTNDKGLVVSWRAEEGFENNARTKVILEGFDLLKNQEIVEGGFGYHCGHFVRVAYETIGIEMMSSSFYQAEDVANGKLGEEITESQIRPGDAIYWSLEPYPDSASENYRKIQHAGIYMGNGKVLEAVGANGTVVIQDVREYSTSVSTYKIQMRVNYLTGNDYISANVQYNQEIEQVTSNVDIVSMQVTNVKAKAGGKEKVRVSWDGISGVDGYLVYAQKNGKYGYVGMTSSSTNILDTKASDSSYNFYWVFPYIYDQDGKMKTGQASKYVYEKGITEAVNELKAKSVLGGVSLQWDAVNDASGYLVYGIVDGKPYEYVGMTTKGETFVDRTASKLQYNYYWVYPYHMNISGRMIVGKTARYTYGRAK